MTNNNPFIKVKKFIEKVLEQYEEGLNEIMSELEIKDIADAIEITNLNTKEVITLDLNNPPSKSKNIIKKLQEKLQQNKIQNFKEEVVLALQKRSKLLKHNRDIVEERLSYFTNNGYKKVIDDIGTFTLDILIIGGEIDLSIEEIKILIGSAIRQKYELYANNLKAKRNTIESQNLIAIDEMNICLMLGHYFDKKGQVKFNYNLEQFNQALHDLFAKQLTIKYPSDKKPYKKYTFKELIESFNQDLIKQNEIQSEIERQNTEKRLLNDQQVEAQKIQQKNQKTSFQLQKQAIAKLSEYYKDGKIIKIHPNIEEFKILIQNCQLPENQAAKIIRLMLANSKEKELTFREKYATILSEEDLKIIEYAQSKNTNNEQYFLQEIISILNLLEISTNKEDINYLKECLEENLENLKYTLNPTEEDIYKLQNKKES